MPHNPFTKENAVHFVEDEGEMVVAWPSKLKGRHCFVDIFKLNFFTAVFIYPEYGEMEVIEEFQENHQFEDHLVSNYIDRFGI